MIEMMIAMTLGLALTGAAIQFMISGNETYNLNDDLSRVQENGRVALDILAKDIRRAGYQENLRGIKPTVVLDTCNHPSTNAAMPCVTEGTNDASDTLPVQYATSDSVNSDCLGGLPTSVAGGTATDVIANVYYIDDPNNTGINSLYCSGFNVERGIQISAGQPLVDGIDRMQVLYRVQRSPSDSGEYMSFDRVRASGREAEITAIRIGLLVSNGLTTGKGDPASKQYQLLDSSQPVDVTNDTQLRRIYTSTIQLNNRHAGESQ